MEELVWMKTDELKQNVNFSSNKFFQQFSENNGIEQKSENYILGILNQDFCFIKNIGSGSSGSVYLAYSIYDKNIQKSLYAIKILDKIEENDDIIKSYEKKKNF